MVSGTFILSSKGYPPTPKNLENGISFSNQEEVGYFDQKNLENFYMTLQWFAVCQIGSH